MKKKEELKIGKGKEIKAKEAMEKGDYDQARKLFEELDKEGSSYATCNLAIMFLRGDGIPASSEKAAALFLKASGRGCIEADYYLGIMHVEDLIAEQNMNEGVEYLTKAANQGHKGAQLYLGMLYAAGAPGFAASASKARDWLLQAGAEPEGLAKAQYYLGKAYEEGLSQLQFDIDLVKAREYFLSAAKKDHKEAQYCLALMCIDGRGGKKDEIAGLEWLAKAARQGYQEAISYLKTYANNCGIGAEDTSKQVPKLIEAVNQFLGEDYSKDLQKMFSELWHPGIPILRSQPFYHYEYKFYHSKQSLPSSKQGRIVYLYVENGVLHYQVLKQSELCQGTLSVPSGFNLDWLKEISFTEMPPSPENIRQIYYRCGTAKTNCCYQVIDDKGDIYVGAVSLAPEEDIEQKLLKLVKNNNYCKEYLELLQKNFQGQLIEKGHIEPSYEDKFKEKILKKYLEICEQEKNLSNFLSNFMVVLENPEFKELFSPSEAFAALVPQHLPVVKELKSKQRDIKNSLIKKPSTSEEMMNGLQFAYNGRIEFKNYCDMVNFIQSLYELMDKDPLIKDKIENFCQKYPDLLPSSQLLNLPVVFGQFMTRRLLLLNDLAKFFSKGHDKFHELDSIFFALNKLVTMINRALPQSCEVELEERNLEMLQSIQSKLAKEKIEVKTLCFDLIKPIFTMLILEVEQMGNGLILSQYHAQKKELVERLETLAKWFQSVAPEHTSIVKEIGKIMEVVQVVQNVNNLASIIERITDLINSIHLVLPQMNLNEINNVNDFFESDQEKLLFNPFRNPQNKQRVLSPQPTECLPSPQTKERLLSPQTKERLPSPQTRERRASGVNSILSLSHSLSLPLANLLARESRILDRTKSSPHHNSDRRSSLREEMGEDSNMKKPGHRQKSDMSSLKQDVTGPNSSPKMAPNSSPKKMRAVQSESYNGGAHPLVDDFSHQKNLHRNKLSESCSVSLNPAGAWQKVTVDSCDSIGRSKRSHSPGPGQISLGNRNLFLSRPISRPNALSVEDRSNGDRRVKENGDRVKEESTRRNVSFNFLEFLSPRQHSSAADCTNLPKLDLT